MFMFVYLLLTFAYTSPAHTAIHHLQYEPSYIHLRPGYVNKSAGPVFKLSFALKYNKKFTSLPTPQCNAM